MNATQSVFTIFKISIIHIMIINPVTEHNIYFKSACVRSINSSAVRDSAMSWYIFDERYKTFCLTVMLSILLTLVSL